MDHPGRDVAVLLPGTGYTVQGPLLAFAAQVLIDRGWHVERVSWTVDASAERDPEAFVEQAVEAAFARAAAAAAAVIAAGADVDARVEVDRRRGAVAAAAAAADLDARADVGQRRGTVAAADGRGGRRLVVAKSFGCSALPWALRAGVAGAWFTPVTTHAPVRDALAAAGPEHWAVGGSADPLWRVDGLATAGAELVTVPDADHGLSVPGDWRASVAAHRAVLERLDAWLAG